MNVAANPGVALVTGASAGIGREFCEQLAQRGYDLILVSRDAARLTETAASLTTRYRVTAEVLAADLTKEDEVGRVATRLAGEPRLALLVNNAGFGAPGRLARADPARQEAMVRLHVLAPIRLTLAALPVLLQRGRGAVINVSSIAGFIYSAGNANYSATKAYLTTLTEGLAAELAGTGVQAQALCPGFTRSEFHRRMQAPPDQVPGFMWMSAASVVRASLRSLDRKGPVVCVPGLRYKALAFLIIRLLPRRAIGWVASRRSGRM
ncbi:MAG: SDR family NAD(P)-dependent oxidoreductase [Gemmatimonadales bacterium]